MMVTLCNRWYLIIVFVLPTISELEMKSDLEDRLVLLDGLGDGHLNLVAQEVSLLVARLDFGQNLLSVRGLKIKQKKLKKPLSLTTILSFFKTILA